MGFQLPHSAESNSPCGQDREFEPEAILLGPGMRTKWSTRGRVAGYAKPYAIITFAPRYVLAVSSTLVRFWSGRTSFNFDLRIDFAATGGGTGDFGKSTILSEPAQNRSQCGQGL